METARVGGRTLRGQRIAEGFGCFNASRISNA